MCRIKQLHLLEINTGDKTLKLAKYEYLKPNSRAHIVILNENNSHIFVKTNHFLQIFFIKRTSFDG